MRREGALHSIVAPFMGSLSAPSRPIGRSIRDRDPRRALAHVVTASRLRIRTRSCAASANVKAQPTRGRPRWRVLCVSPIVFRPR